MHQTVYPPIFKGDHVLPDVARVEPEADAEKGDTEEKALSQIMQLLCLYLRRRETDGGRSMSSKSSSTS